MAELAKKMQYLFDLRIQFNLSDEDYGHVEQALTVRNIEADYDIVKQLFQAKILPSGLKPFFESLLVRGDEPEDFYLLFAVYQAIKTVKSDFKDYWLYWTSKEASTELFQTLLKYAKAGARPTYLDLLIDNQGDIKTNLKEILSMRESDTNEKTKQEDFALLVQFIDSGCTDDQIKAMFEFVTNKATNKELQQYYNNNQEQLKNNPEALASLLTTKSQIV